MICASIVVLIACSGLRRDGERDHLPDFSQHHPPADSGIPSRKLRSARPRLPPATQLDAVVGGHPRAPGSKGGALGAGGWSRVVRPEAPARRRQRPCAPAAEAAPPADATSMTASTGNDGVGHLAEAYGPLMAYDVEAESRQLIADGLPDQPVQLSRRRRFAPVAVDVDDDVACTWFVRRGVGCFWDEIHLLVREDNGWRYQGGGGGSSGEPWSTDEFVQARDELSVGDVRVGGGASVRVDLDRRLPWGGRWLRSAQLLVGRSVAIVVIDAQRRLLVPYHGRVVVVWASRRSPELSARDAAGYELARIVLPTGR
jgi:hypothetical protein